MHFYRALVAAFVSKVRDTNLNIHMYTYITISYYIISDLFARVYASALRSLAGRQSEGDDNDGDEAAETHTIAPSLQSITDSLRQLGLWEMLYTVEASALKNHIHRRLKEAVDESPGGAVLEEALEYNGTVPLQYLEMLRDPKVQVCMPSLVFFCFFP